MAGLKRGNFLSELMDKEVIRFQDGTAGVIWHENPDGSMIIPPLIVDGTGLDDDDVLYDIYNDVRFNMLKPWSFHYLNDSLGRVHAVTGVTYDNYNSLLKAVSDLKKSCEGYKSICDGQTKRIVEQMKENNRLRVERGIFVTLSVIAIIFIMLIYGYI